MAKRKEKKTLRQALQDKRKQERLEDRRVALIRDLPALPDLRRETEAHFDGNQVGMSAVLAYTRHHYTNYDTLCDRAIKTALRTRLSSPILNSIVADYRYQANELIKAAVGWKGEASWR